MTTTTWLIDFKAGTMLVVPQPEDRSMPIYVDARNAQILHAVIQDRGSLAHLFGVEEKDLPLIVYYEIASQQDPSLDDIPDSLSDGDYIRVDSWNGFYTDIFSREFNGTKVLFCILMNENQYVDDFIVWATTYDHEVAGTHVGPSLKELLPRTYEALNRIGEA